MSSSDAQPPLSRRQARERERAAAASGQPVTPPPTVADPTDQPEGRRRPGSHVAPSPSGPAQSAARPTSGGAPGSTGGVFPLAPAPASATEIVPGTGGLTRRQLRLMREAEGHAVQPVPLQAPTPHSSDRTVQDVIGSVDRLDEDAQRVRPASAIAPRPTPAPAPERAAPDRPDAAERPSPTAGDRPASAQSAVRSAEVPLAPTPAIDARHDDQTDRAAAGSAADRHQDGSEPQTETELLDPAAVAQATEADGSPDAVESLSEAVAHAEEPRRHRSTWAPPEDDEADSATAGAGDAERSVAVPPTPSSSTPVVFPLSLDDDTNEVPVQRPTPATASRADADADAEAPRVPAAFQRRPEPKPVTTAFEPPAGHWSQQADDVEVHDTTGTRRVAVQDTNSIVLPNSALADPTGALNATGEVILTGSIDLPASLSSTGSHRPIDGAEVDRLLEQHDEQPETDASPVRASRAVSSHTSTRQVVLAAAKPKESRTPVILGVTVGAVGLAAAGVIIVALLTTHFGG
ncbi:hypothetical protein DEJ23_12800 [Curtobacterium sp. MCSS17_008]|uniref:hypothetical protein n=1 Tax=Curtobacterium sp. MCSS17_008 TaxID=2175647 RepID=UPI000DA948C3|nr:hypothetical protein [Curtobacterium sp. MCSS17_008]PZF55022.1 hypothetical protein DEJ23_12800 [Curtobacterium sp. MCSS17_008]